MNYGCCVPFYVFKIYYHVLRSQILSRKVSWLRVSRWFSAPISLFWHFSVLVLKRWFTVFIFIS